MQIIFHSNGSIENIYDRVLGWHVDSCPIAVVDPCVLIYRIKN